MTDWLGQIGKAAATGATLGSVVPGIGTAIGGAGGAAIGLAMQLVPDLAKLVSGSTDTVGKIETVMQKVTGTPDPVAQVAAAADPQVAADLRVQLAQIVADAEAARDQFNLDAFKSALGDVAGARAQTLALAGTGSKMAWGSAVVSVIVLLTFGGVMVLSLTRALPPTAEPVLNVLMGTLGALATTVVSYWVGSSAGSAAKSERQQHMVPISLVQPPTAVVPAADK